jgi:Zn-dependent M28 family amino/carboxypeptidase
VFVFFGAEEVGLVGSRRFATAPPIAGRIVAMVNVDMIRRPLLDQPLLTGALAFAGVDSKRAVGLVGARRFPALRAIANAAFAAEGGTVVASEDFPEPIRSEVDRQTAGRGDSVAFDERGIPALFFGDGESIDYHKPTDTIDKLTPALLAARARAIARVVVALSRAPAAAFR